MNTYTLKNGLRVAFVPRQGNALGICLLGNAGALYGTPGLAHFLEHTVLCATEKYPEFNLLANSVDNLGLSRNAYTSHESMGFIFKCLPDHFAQACEFLSEVTVRPLLLESDIEKQRKIISQEIRKKLSDPVGFAGIEALRRAYGESGPGIPVLGSEESILKIQRADLAAFFRDRFAADNFVLVVAGTVDQNEALATLERTLGSMPSASKGRALPEMPMAEAQRAVIERRGISQAVLVVGWRAYTMDDPSRYPAYVLRCLLTSGRLSRLWQALRQETGMVYSVTSHLARGKRHGHLTVVTGLSNENVEPAISRIGLELEKIADGGVTDLDMERAKNQIRSEIAFETDSALSCAEYYANKLLLDPEFADVESEVSKYERVRKEDVARVARELIDRGTYVTIVKAA